MATVSARISKELKKKISEEGIEVSSFIRQKLEEELERRERERGSEIAEEFRQKKVETSDIADMVREDRDR